MSKSYRNGAFALGIILATSAWPQSASEEEPRQEESATNTQDNGEGQYAKPQDLTPALENIEAAIRDLIAEEDKVETQRRRDAESRDLNAQEGMAWWAELMFYAAAATVVLTLAALYAIIRTLHHTRRAADYTEGMLVEAKTTTRAAQDAVIATRDIGEKQLRAYLYVSKSRSEIIGTSKTKNIDVIVVTIVFKNFGATPATEIECTIANRCVTYGTRMPDNTDYTAIEVDMACAPNYSFSLVYPCHLPVGAIEAVKSGGLQFELHFRMKYRDVFGNLQLHEDVCMADSTTIGIGLIGKHGDGKK